MAWVGSFEGPAGRVYHGDCEELMPKLKGKVDLAFADPPFNVGEDYGSYDDTREPYEYLKQMQAWVAGVASCLKDGGTAWFNIPVDKRYYVLHAASSCGLGLRCDVIWHYRFGQHTNGNFIPSHTHLLYYIKVPGWPKNDFDSIPHTWNPKDILVPSDRATVYNDKRTRGKKGGNDGMRVPFDVWSDIPRVTGNSKERVRERPNQLPERLLARIVRATSNPGDLVFDPFGGTGTTFVVARALGRRAVTCEIDRRGAQGITRRAKKGAVNVG